MNNNIIGWMNEAELAWLAEQSSSRRLIVEVGSWLGRSAVTLASSGNNCVICVDEWKGEGFLLPDQPENHKTAVDQFIRSFRDNGYADFLENTEGLNIVPLRLASLDAASILPNKFFDMVFIDADHTYQSASQDILAWSRKLKEGGLLCGHDYSEAFRDHVVKAVDELVPDRQIIDTIWYDTVHYATTKPRAHSDRDSVCCNT